ncbi:RDD family protein [uncultured Massilia sp.]|uniref:RDD family protein n=1 Tax=uncultured Massilia sp. TaxID=169973 RepID=UPI00258A1CBD|nr:RDD family protein [uncultured Massilia sp.]
MERPAQKSVPHASRLDGRALLKARFGLSSETAARAWPRWFARTFDVWWHTGLVATFLGFTLCRTSPGFLRWLETPFGWKLFGLTCIPAGLLLDAIVQAVAGNTPGKAMLGLRVVTADGRFPGLREIVGRNMGVWGAGFAFGLPAVSLLTMARQGLRLGRGEPASYDDDYFLVRARPVGWCRKTVFALAFIALFLVVVLLDAMDRQDSREMAAVLAASPYAWTNPDTGRQITVPPQWRYETFTDEDGAVLRVFTEHTEHAVVLLAREAHGDATIAQYSRALAERLANQAALPGGQLEEFRGKASWVVTGEEKEGAARVRLRVVEVHGNAWRVMAMQSPPAAYTDDLVEALEQGLWDTVTPRQGRSD